MSTDDSELVSEVAERIVAYIEQHPQAADALRGICAYWLGDQDAQAPEAIVDKALTRLVDRGVLERHVNVSGEVTFKRRLHA